MKVSLRLLALFVELPRTRPVLSHTPVNANEFNLADIDLNLISKLLTKQGFEVEGVTLPNPHLDHVVLGKILKTEKHPNASKLQVCQVLFNHKEVKQIVCGASNARENMYVAAALPGAQLPTGLTIKSSSIRDVSSDGMLCSREELGLPIQPRDGSGIWEMEQDYLEWFGASYFESKLGMPVLPSFYADDIVLELNVTPNRPDMLCHQGVARELAAGLAVEKSQLNALKICSFVHPQTLPQPLHSMGKKDEPALGKRWGSDAVLTESQIRNACLDDKPIYFPNSHTFRAYTQCESGAFFVGLGDLNPVSSPPWVRHVYDALGLNPIQSVVDASNLVLVCFGQPSHAFDLEKCGVSSEKSLVIRRALEKEGFLGLDGKNRELLAQDVVVASESGPQALLGVIGGEHSKVTESTRYAVVEFAFPKPVEVRKSSRRHGRKTDSSFQFEKGIDASQRLAAARELVHAISYLSKKEVTFLGATWTQAQGDFPVQTLDQNLGYSQAALGIPYHSHSLLHRVGSPLVDFESQLRILSFLGFGLPKPLEVPAGATDALLISVPHWRKLDCQGAHDLVEEVVRMVGIDKIPAVPMESAHVVRDDDSHLAALERIAQSAVHLGYTQVESFHFMKEGDIGRLTQSNTENKLGAPVTLLNPIIKDEPTLHTSLLPGLLRKVARNLSLGVEQGLLFEVARTYQDLDSQGNGVFQENHSDLSGLFEYHPQYSLHTTADSSLGRPAETPRLAGVVFGVEETKQWHNSGAQPWNFHYVWGQVDELIHSFLKNASLTFVTLDAKHPLCQTVHPQWQNHIWVHSEDGSTSAPVGVVAQLHPKVGRSFDCETKVLFFELNLASLWEFKDKTTGIIRSKSSTSVPLPCVKRDFAFLIPVSLNPGRFVKELRPLMQENLESRTPKMKLKLLEVFDIFTGKGVAENWQSVAIRLELEPLEKTLTDADITSIAQYVETTVQSRFGGQLRS